MVSDPNFLLFPTCTDCPLVLSGEPCLWELADSYDELNMVDSPPESCVAMRILQNDGSYKDLLLKPLFHGTF